MDLARQKLSVVPITGELRLMITFSGQTWLEKYGTNVTGERQLTIEHGG